MTTLEEALHKAELEEQRRQREEEAAAESDDGVEDESDE